MINDPNRFKLSPEQEIGARFLADNKHALLADIMGVGKSAQAIRACDHIGAKKIVVVCQASKRMDWKNEFPKFETLKRKTQIFYKCVSKSKFSENEVVIVSYDMVGQLLNAMEKAGWAPDVLIIDEVQFLKSVDAKRTKYVLGKHGLVRKAKYIWLLSGTPMLNHAGEIWSWLYTLFPKTITLEGEDKPLTYERYTDRYCLKKETRWGTQIYGSKNLPELRERIAPIMLRRTVEMTKNLPSAHLELISIARKEITHPEDLRNLAMIDQIKGLKLLKEITEQIEEGRDVDLATLEENADHMAYLRQLTAIAKAKPVAGILMHELYNAFNKKVVVFGVHRAPMYLLLRYLRAYNIPSMVILGGMTDKKKNNFLNMFINNPLYKVLIGQIDTLGTGIDGLQHATNEVVFLESSWTPSVNLQAIARVRRLGQRFPVRVRFIGLEDSIDDIVMRIVHRKTAEVAQLFN